MKKDWVLVADQSKARLFETGRTRKQFNLLKDLAHPQGHQRNQDLTTDKPGRAFDSSGQGRHALGKSESPALHEAKTFANDIAKTLKAGRGNNQFDQLILVAEPGFLGMIKSALDKHTLEQLGDTVDKDFAQVADGDLPALLTQYLKPRLSS